MILNGHHRTVSIPGVKLDQIRADDVDARLTAAGEAGNSARSVNLELEAASALLNWCVRNGRLRANPLRVIQKRNQVLDQKRNQVLDPKRIRRVLTEKETGRLIDVAREQARLTESPTRPLWYLFPLLPGLRRGDLIRMAWRDLQLGAAPPTLTIRGGKARRRVDVLPLHPELVRELRRVRPKNALPSARVFPATVTNTTRQKDFQRAGIILKTDNGHADLHALRHTFGTRLAQRGVAPAKLQRLMRHATVQLTMAFYVHLDVDALSDGLLTLPDVEAPEASSRVTAS